MSQTSLAHQTAGHCASGSLRDLLAHQGLDFGQGPLSEGMCFGLGGGLGFLYAEVPDVRPPIYLVGRTEALEEDFAAHLQIPLEVRQTDDPAEGLGWVQQELAQGRPALVWTDIAELEYLRVRMSNTRHALIIAGLDLDEQTAWVADNDRAELQACSLSSLAAARNSHGFPGPNRHRTFVFDWPTRLRDPAQAGREAILRCVQNMRHGGAELGGMDAPSGLNGLQAFAAAYATWPERFDDRLAEVLGALSVFIVKAGTGGAMFRSLYAEFLHDLAALLEDAALAALADRADTIAGAWRQLAAHARGGQHQPGVSCLGELCRLETELIDGLSDWLDA